MWRFKNKSPWAESKGDKKKGNYFRDMSISQIKTFEEAKENVKKSIEAWLEVMNDKVKRKILK